MDDVVQKWRRTVCRVVGHKHGWGVNGEPYGEAVYRITDGTGTAHFDVQHVCERCGRKMTLARFHGNQEARQALQERNNERTD